MKVLVTGGMGYIFSRGIPELLKWEKNGEKIITELVSIDNQMYNQCTHFESSLDTRYSFVNQDVADINEMKPYYDWADLIIPAACITGAPLCDKMKARAWDINYHVIRDMCDYLYSTRKTPKIIYPCSNSGYGSYPDGRPVTEADKLCPLSIYAKSKVAAEDKVLMRGAISYRLATVMGTSPFQRIGLLVNTLVYRALKDRVLPIYQGHYQRNYLYIGDFIEAVKIAIDKYDEMSGEIYNIGDTRANMTKMELAQLVSKHTGAEIIEIDNMSDPDRRSYLVSNAKIEAMGFKPTKSVEDVIQELIRFYSAVDERSHSVYFGTT